MGREAFETKRTARIAQLELALIQAATPELWLRLARVRLQQGRGAEALDALERAVWEASAQTLEGTLYDLGWPWDVGGGEASAYTAVLSDPQAAEGLAVDGGLRVRTRWLLARLAAAHDGGGAWVERLRGELKGGLGDLAAPECVATRLEGATLEAWLVADREAIGARLAQESF